MTRSLSSGVILSALIIAGHAHGAVILSPTAVVQNTLGDRSATVDIGNVIDQSGLSGGYVSGVTDFDTYLAGTPEHDFRALENEWFATGGTTSGTIDFDLGGVYAIDRVAIWNEDAAGVSRFELVTALDATFATSTLIGTFSLTDTARGVDYLAEVLTLGIVSPARYVRFNILGAYADVLGLADQASLGEVAFSAVPIADVPEPGGIALGAMGLLGAGAAARVRARGPTRRG